MVDQLFINGFDPSYTRRVLYGERIEALEVSTFGLGSGDLMKLDYSKESGYEMHAMLDDFGVGLYANSNNVEMSNGDILECD